MANQVWLRRADGAVIDELSMSNGATRVVYETLLVAGSHLAACDQQRDLIVFIASQDQETKGTGLACFDVNDMPWRVEDFVSQRQFLLSVIDAAIAEHGWSRLGYSPGRPEQTKWCLRKFASLLQRLEAGWITPPHASAWPVVTPGSMNCPVHDVLTYTVVHHGQHEEYCLLCNSELQKAEVVRRPSQSVSNA